MRVGEYFGGKGFVVTGAASRIGFAVAEALLEAGAVVFMADRDTEMLSSAADYLGDFAGRRWTSPARQRYSSAAELNKDLLSTATGILEPGDGI